MTDHDEPLAEYTCAYGLALDVEIALEAAEAGPTAGEGFAQYRATRALINGTGGAAGKRVHAGGRLHSPTILGERRQRSGRTRPSLSLEVRTAPGELRGAAQWTGDRRPVMDDLPDGSPVLPISNRTNHTDDDYDDQ